MGVDGEPINNSEIARRVEIDAKKEMIKAGDIYREDDLDLPRSGTEEKEIIRSFGFTGVETVDDLYNKTRAVGYSHTLAQEKLGILARAVYETMAEHPGSHGVVMRQALVAGPFAVDRCLNRVFIGSDKENPEAGGFSSLVYNEFLKNFSTQDRRDSVFAIMANVDYLKNGPTGSGEINSKRESVLYDQLGTSIEEVKKISVSVFNQQEMAAKTKILEYLVGVKEHLEVGRIRVDKSKSGHGDKKVGTGGEPLQTPVDYRAMSENRQNRGNEGGEYRNPYEVPYSNYVDSIFNYEDPRLYFTPPPEWVDVLDKEKQRILKIGTKLARGIMYKLGTKDIDYVKLRSNEIYNFPKSELKLIYEKVPGFRQGLESIVQEFFVFGNEDGCKFLNVKTDKDLLLNKMGNFELYKEYLYKRIALKEKFGIEISPDLTMDETKREVDGHIKRYVDEFKRKNVDRLKRYTDLISKGYSPENAIKSGGWSELEAERRWEYKNTYAYKEGLAFAVDFAGVSMIFESGDVKRDLKPSQITGDKLRTMMMPLQKFLQKNSFVPDKDPELSEAFGGDVGTFMEEMAIIKGDDFKKMVVDVANENRSEMSQERANWRVFPKRQFCSFFDMYIVNREYDSDSNPIKGTGKTLAEVLMKGEKVEFDIGNEDLDIFVQFRDTWDEVNSINPYVIGKGEFKGVPKLNAPVTKEGGLARGYKNIRMIDGTLGSLPFVNNPEYYAWLLGNSIGLEKGLDIAMLDQDVLGNNQSNYDSKVYSAINDLQLRPLKNDKDFRDRVSAVTRKIFTANRGWKHEIQTAFGRKASRVSKSRKNQKSILY